MGTSTEYPNFVPWNIEQIHGSVTREVARKTLAEAIALEEKRSAERSRKNAKNGSGRRKHLDRLIPNEDRFANKCRPRKSRPYGVRLDEGFEMLSSCGHGFDNN